MYLKGVHQLGNVYETTDARIRAVLEAFFIKSNQTKPNTKQIIF